VAQMIERQGKTIVSLSESARLDELLGELVRQVRTAQRDRIPASDDGVLLLDADIDGIRCILLRSPLESHKLHLSPREREIGRMVAKGYANKTIASVLDISTWTVGTHLRRIFAKLGVSTRAAMVAQLLGEGLLNDHSDGRVS
jgi:DNA-binding CsgD family transcriptional regulator